MKLLVSLQLLNPEDTTAQPVSAQQQIDLDDAALVRLSALQTAINGGEGFAPAIRQDIATGLGNELLAAAKQPAMQCVVDICNALMKAPPPTVNVPVTPATDTVAPEDASVTATLTTGHRRTM